MDEVGTGGDSGSPDVPFSVLEVKPGIVGEEGRLEPDVGDVAISFPIPEHRLVGVVVQIDRIHFGIRVVLPADAVGRVCGPDAALGLAPVVEHLVALLRVGFVKILEDSGRTQPVGVAKDEIVASGRLFAAIGRLVVELSHRRLLPAEAVLGDVVAEQAGGPVVVDRLVPHLEAVVLAVVDEVGRVGEVHVRLPALVHLDHRIPGILERLVQQLEDGAVQRLDDVVVDEELLVGADLQHRGANRRRRRERQDQGQTEGACGMGCSNPLMGRLPAIHVASVCCSGVARGTQSWYKNSSFWFQPMMGCSSKRRMTDESRNDRRVFRLRGPRRSLPSPPPRHSPNPWPSAPDWSCSWTAT